MSLSSLNDSICKWLDIIMQSQIKFYALTDEPTIAPCLYIWHLNCCLEGTVQTSLLLLSSLIKRSEILSE